ncbi:MAG: peptidase M23, partial [Shewanella oncorhynchi]
MQTGKPNFINLSQTRLQNLSSTQKNILLMGSLLMGAAMLMPNNNHVTPTAQRIPVVL